MSLDCVNATESQVKEELCKATKAMEETITKGANEGVVLNGIIYKSLQARVEENNSVVLQYKQQTETLKDETKTYRDEARADKEYIEGYSIPTEATYSPITIDAKVDMAEVLYLTGA